MLHKHINSELNCFSGIWACDACVSTRPLLIHKPICHQTPYIVDIYLVSIRLCL